VRIRDLGRSARDRRTPLKDYTRRVVMPTLVERGLYRRAEYRMLGLFPATRYVETAAGAAARAELEALKKKVTGTSSSPSIETRGKRARS
jgi:hypothetical protein